MEPDYGKLGAQRRSPDERDVLLGAVQAPVQISDVFLPDNSWLVTNFQGSTPTCGSHAASHFQAILERINVGGDPRYNPRYTWIKIKAIDGFPLSVGTDMRSIFKALQANGTDDFEPLENDVTLPLETYSSPSVITPAMDVNASTKKISSYAFGNTDFDSLRQAIFQNKAVLLLIHCDDGFWGTQHPTFTTAKYGHFVVADGYDTDSIRIVDSADATAENRIKFLNRSYITPTFIVESGTALDIPPPTKPIPPAPVLPAAPTVQQELTWLDLLKVWFNAINDFLKGRNQSQ